LAEQQFVHPRQRSVKSFLCRPPFVRQIQPLQAGPVLSGSGGIGSRYQTAAEIQTGVLVDLEEVLQMSDIDDIIAFIGAEACFVVIVLHLEGQVHVDIPWIGNQPRQFRTGIACV
jgi:hypothetical protein